MKKIKIIIRDDNYIRLFAPLSFAYDFANKGIQVDVLFLNLALLVILAFQASHYHLLTEWQKQEMQWLI